MRISAASILEMSLRSRSRVRSSIANRLLFGDNLKWLRDKSLFPDGSIDLVYLDPPFNSNANYNVLFKEASGEASQAQFHAFTDTWEWTREVDDTYRQFVDTCPNASVVEPFPDA